MALGPTPELRSQTKGTKKSEALWMMTFSDLSLILMCFFALLLSMSVITKHKFDAVNEGFKKVQNERKTRSLDEIYRLVKSEIRKRRLEKSVAAGLDSDGLTVEFKSGGLFKPGSYRLQPGFKKVAGQIMEIIAKTPKDYHLAVEGHTDDSGSESTNWQLSARRGISMLDAFKQRGVKLKEMKVVAFAHTKPKVAYAGKKGRSLIAAREANRRVVIRIN